MGVFTYPSSRVGADRRTPLQREAPLSKRFMAWLIDRLSPRAFGKQSLRIVERIRVTPRQALILVEVEGERLLVATSDVSAPAFYPVKRRPAASRNRRPIEIKIEGTGA